MKLLSFLILIGLGYIHSAQSQTYIQETGKVVYRGYDVDSLMMDPHAKSINQYIAKYYPKKKLPFIYIWNGNNPHLSYDSYRGNSMENKLYDRNNRYDQPGIRITIPKSSENPTSDYLKLVDYGICNLKALKRRYKELSNLDFNDRPDEYGIDPQQLTKILSNSNEKVDRFLRE